MDLEGEKFSNLLEEDCMELGLGTPSPRHSLLEGRGEFREVVHAQLPRGVFSDPGL